jgi:hypothetical protein
MEDQDITLDVEVSELFSGLPSACQAFDALGLRTLEDVYSVVLAQGAHVIRASDEEQARSVEEATQVLGSEVAAYLIAPATDMRPSVALAAGTLAFAAACGLDPAAFGVLLVQALQRVPVQSLDSLHQAFVEGLETERFFGALLRNGAEDSRSATDPSPAPDGSGMEEPEG